MDLEAPGALTPYFYFFYWAQSAQNPYCGFTAIMVVGVPRALRAPGALRALGA